MTPVEEERKERMRRNEAMLRQVTGAAKDLASVVPLCDNVGRRQAFKDRLASEACQHGPRKSTRSASSAARKRILNSLRDDQSNHASPGASASGSMQSEADLDEEHLESASLSDDFDDMNEDNEDNGDALADTQQGRSVHADGSMPHEDYDMQLAIAISLESDGDEKGTGDVVAIGTPSRSQSRIDCHPSAGSTAHADGTTPLGNAGFKPPGRRQATGAEGKKSRRKHKKRLNLTDEDLDAVFDFMAGGKVTIGVAEVVSVINKLGLDIDDTMVGAAFEVLEESSCSGPCNRVDKGGLRKFVEKLED